MPGIFLASGNFLKIMLAFEISHTYRLIIEEQVLAPPDGTDGFHDGSTPLSPMGLS